MLERAPGIRLAVSLGITGVDMVSAAWEGLDTEDFKGPCIEGKAAADHGGPSPESWILGFRVEGFVFRV